MKKRNNGNGESESEIEGAELVYPNVTVATNTTYSNLPSRRMNFVYPATSKPCAPTKLFGTSCGTEQPSLSPLNRRR